jgi:hypothetical protein
MARRLARALAIAVASLTLEAPARAAPGDPINSNHYAVELFQGPLLAPLRVTGLGGAYGPYAEGADGLPANAAAPAVREPYSVSYLDWDLAFSVAFPATFGHTDFDNDGRVGFTYSDFVFYSLGGMMQVGPFGAGVLGDFQRYNLSPGAGTDDPRSSLTLGRVHVLGGWSLLGGQLCLGGGGRGVMLSVETSSPAQEGQTALSMIGIAPQAGVLVRPDYQPWRIGATFRSAVDGAIRQEGAVRVDEAGARRAAGLAIPESVHMPWEMQAGFAIQVGPRPLNPKWIDPAEQEHAARREVEKARRSRAAAHAAELDGLADPAARAARAARIDRDEQYLQREEERRLDKLEDDMLAERRARYWNWPREYVLLVADALVTGPSTNAVSLESFLSQTELRAGDRATVTPRLGLEGEPVVGVLKTRIGTYVEPSRFAGHASRQHFTFGFDVRVFEFKGWGILSPATYRLSGVADLAPRYENIGVSFGAWH